MPRQQTSSVCVILFNSRGQGIFAVSQMAFAIEPSVSICIYYICMNFKYVCKQNLELCKTCNQLLDLGHLLFS